MARKIIKLQRINRSQFLTDVGALWMVIMIAIIGVIYVNPIDVTGGIRPIIQSVMNFLGMKYYFVGGFILAAMIFSYLYIGRMMDRGISPWLSVIPLLLFYGCFIYFFYHLMVVLQETNYLQFFARAKRFFEVPSLANFEPLFSDHWRDFLDQKKRYLDAAILMAFFLLIMGIGIPGSRQPNRFGSPRIYKVSQSIIGGIAGVLFILPLLYIGGQILLIDTPSLYFRDYEHFLNLLRYFTGR